MKTTDEFWMRRCLVLAEKGTGKVSPNPLVGAVIVRNGKKIGEGFHRKYGDAHAEVNAIRDAIHKGYDLRGSTMYINLEPCFHYGHTPPCVNTIIRHGFSRVVLAMNDPNPLVAGKSVKKLVENDILCTAGVLQKEAEYLNEKFVKYITTGIPFVALKMARTADGFIAREDGSSRWITNKKSRIYVHRLRNKYDAVIVGANTVKKDDPELTVRHIKGRNPVRVVINGNFSLLTTKKIFGRKAETILFVSKESVKKNKNKAAFLSKKKVSVITLPSARGIVRMKDILGELAKKKISSVLVEGGGQMYSAFLKENLVDKLYLFTAKKKFGNGLKAFNGRLPRSTWSKGSKRMFGTDSLIELYIQ